MEDKENHQAENESFEVKQFIINMTAGLYEAKFYVEHVRIVQRAVLCAWGHSNYNYIIF